MAAAETAPYVQLRILNGSSIHGLGETESDGTLLLNKLRPRTRRVVDRFNLRTPNPTLQKEQGSSDSNQQNRQTLHVSDYTNLLDELQGDFDHIHEGAFFFFRGQGFFPFDMVADGQ